jgi:hypothetical protein
MAFASTAVLKSFKELAMQPSQKELLQCHSPLKHLAVRDEEDFEAVAVGSSWSRDNINQLHRKPNHSYSAFTVVNEPWSTSTSRRSVSRDSLKTRGREVVR